MGSSLKWIIESCLRFVPYFSFTQCKNWWSTKGRTTGSVIPGRSQISLDKKLGDFEKSIDFELIDNKAFPVFEN